MGGGHDEGGLVLGLTRSLVVLVQNCQLLVYLCTYTYLGCS